MPNAINLIDHKSDKKFLEQKFNSFKSAHIQSAGKQTRPDITWEIMKSLISKRKACLFTLSLKNIIPLFSNYNDDSLYT